MEEGKKAKNGNKNDKHDIDNDGDGDNSDDSVESGESDWGEEGMVVHELVPSNHDFSGVDLKTREGTISKKKLAKLYV